jgi:hypothetical protein
MGDLELEENCKGFGNQIQVRRPGLPRRGRQIGWQRALRGAAPKTKKPSMRVSMKR